ncbi:hypothetical protein [Streptomyces clavuligerus]|uniref:hypothetical protein n=1 Tax=Streptomyces clavuligerus TaxID=1901 RepID=UPI00017FF6D9|nr:hypothetical protein [Streptomyces clavuligerus]EDY49274.1 hypothetical protein SSCG_02302 [Streptomyces clavuligerus]WDN56176.1 hypothetical protein LL058_30435 [Streptomyces clavuligerus]
MDTSIPEHKTARFTAAAKFGVNLTPACECTLADRAAWASEALMAYNSQAPKDVLSAPELAERVRLGVLAAEAMARVAFDVPGDQVVVDQESADRVIGDLVTQVFCLTDGRVSADELYEAAQELRGEEYPVKLDALGAVAAAGAEREAAMLSTLLDAAQFFGCDVPDMVFYAREYFEDLRAEEAETARP